MGLKQASPDILYFCKSLSRLSRSPICVFLCPSVAVSELTLESLLDTLMVMQEFSALDGAILIDKPAGPTSHDVVDEIRREFGIKKVGHCGTLDPNATGLLIIVLGRGTKLSEKLMGDDKVYEGAIKFGVVTDSYDADGEVKETKPVPALSLEQLNALASEFIGDQMQTPPMVSAIKKDGVPLYKLARKGVEVEREPRLVHIYNFRFTNYTEPLGDFRLACTKGTYVRSIAHDLGQKIGCGAHLSTLRRSASGKFDVADATPLDTVLRMKPSELEKKVIPFLKLSA
jgi:tRNA pseudouridine55 synthase